MVAAIGYYIYKTVQLNIALNPQGNQVAAVGLTVKKVTLPPSVGKFKAFHNKNIDITKLTWSLPSSAAKYTYKIYYTKQFDTMYLVKKI
jgi:hypothetical protein